jgi:hypothetical protein
MASKGEFMFQKIFLCLVSVAFLSASACTKKTEKRTLDTPRLFTCSSEATLRKNDKDIIKDSKTIVVDFNAPSDKKGPMVEHIFDNQSIFVEFWSNDPNGAAATAIIKGILMRTQWTGGFSHSAGLPDTFEILLDPHKLSENSEVSFKIDCHK